MIEIGEKKFQKSSVIEKGKQILHEERTSETCWISRNENKLIEEIDKRIYSILKLPFYSSIDDELQLLKYSAGAQYKCHYDYFWNENFVETKNVNFCQGVNRFLTFFIYFNDVESGGETCFCKIKSEDGPKNGTCQGLFTVKPKAGNAIFWYNFKPNFSSVQEKMEPDTMSEHAGCPVWSGVKYASNKWIWNKHRNNRFLGDQSGFFNCFN